MSARPEPRLSALDLFFEDPKRAGAEIQKALEDKKVRETMPDHGKRLTATAARFVTGAVVEAIQSLLDQIGVHGMLAGGWQRVEEVERARVATRADHGARFVQLAEHEITSHHEPLVEVVVNEVATPLLHLALDVTLTVKAADLLIEDGEIVGASPVAVSTAATLMSGPVLVLKHEIAQLDTARLAERRVEKSASAVRRAAVDGGP